MQEDNNLVQGLMVLIMHDLLSYIHMDGTHVFCEYKDYLNCRNDELNKYVLTENQFNAVVDYAKMIIRTGALN